jgi:2-hydroxychromene-2-carboxylate isomerase
MTSALDFYFYIGSTYTYLAVNRVEELAAAYGRAVRWRPFSVRDIMIEQKNIPFREKPVKAAYMRRDIERRAARHGIAFTAFPQYPVDSEQLATRTALVGVEDGWCPAFTRAVYEAWFLRNETPGDPAVLAPILERLGLDAAATLAQADSPEVREAYRIETGKAKALGIFGAPTFVAGGEIFWGDDRLEEALEWTGHLHHGTAPLPEPERLGPALTG